MIFADAPHGSDVWASDRQISSGVVTFTPDIVYRPAFREELKHNRERIDVEIDASGILPTGETLRAVRDFVIAEKREGDVSSEFGSPTGHVKDGTKVQFALPEASSSTEQQGGQYTILVECETSEGKRRVIRDSHGGVPILRIITNGDPTR